jgi:hypothetical protein
MAGPRGMIRPPVLRECGPAVPQIPPWQRRGTGQPEARSRSTANPTSAAQREQGARKGPLQGEASGRLAKSASGGGGECRRSGPRVDRGSGHARWDGTLVTNRQPFRGDGRKGGRPDGGGGRPGGGPEGAPVVHRHPHALARRRRARWPPAGSAARSHGPLRPLHRPSFALPSRSAPRILPLVRSADPTPVRRPAVALLPGGAFD